MKRLLEIYIETAIKLNADGFKESVACENKEDSETLRLLLVDNLVFYETKYNLSIKISAFANFRCRVIGSILYII